MAKKYEAYHLSRITGQEKEIPESILYPEEFDPIYELGAVLWAIHNEQQYLNRPGIAPGDQITVILNNKIEASGFVKSDRSTDWTF